MTNNQALNELNQSQPFSLGSDWNDLVMSIILRVLSDEGQDARFLR